MNGIATIELTNIYTGVKEKIIEKNMVTNVFKDALNIKLRNFDVSSYLFPVYKNSLGGIFLFGDNMEENQNIYVVPNDMTIIGHAGSDGYLGTNNRRGSLNINETMELENGYKMVWDFNTSQANGEIKCISLTHNNAGKSGLGSKINEESISNSNLLFNIRASINGRDNSSIIELDYSYTILYRSTTSIIIGRYNPCFKRFNLKSMSEFYVDKKIEIPYGFTEYNNKRTDICVSNDKIYIYASSKLDGGKSKLFIVNKITMEFEKEIDYSDDLFYNYNEVSQISVREGFVYFFVKKNANSDIIAIKINLQNSTDRKEIRAGFSFKDGYFYVKNALGRIFSAYFIIDKNDNVEQFNDSINVSSLTNIYNNIIFTGFTNSGTNYSLLFNNSYLATINNLQTPIVKTADKTMKITYIITES